LAALACAILLLPTGWKGTRVTQILWPSYLGKVAVTSSEARVEALTEAIRRWPQATFHQERAAIFHENASSGLSAVFHEPAERAITDYRKASQLNPYDPGLAINIANLLSQLQRDSEAEEHYIKAISLQGGMEAGFRSHFYLALHLYHKGLRLFNFEKPEIALNILETAAVHMEEAVKQTPPWVINIDGRNARISIHESLGAAREANGDYQGAMAAYDFTVTLTNGARAHYRAGVLHAKMATTAWNERRPAEALAHFIEAKNRIGRTNELPQGVTPSQRAEYLAYLDRTLTFLKGAKIEPAKLPN
jgi:tetratricopeptide (TPR) repeat protein